MENISFDSDITVFYVTAESFPAGITEAHNRLHRLVPFSSERRYFGLSRPENENYDIYYRAAAEELAPGEGANLGCETLTIKKGEYISLVVDDFRTDILSIDRAFKQLLAQPNLDPNGYCVESYFTDKEAVRCMIRLDPGVTKNELT